MRASLLDELLDDFMAPTPANAANSANRQQPRGPLADQVPCEDLRILANGEPATPSTAQDSQTFAAVRRPASTRESEERRGFSQDSQDSQGLPDPKPSCPDLSAVAWTDEDIARFLARRARLLRWGWCEAEAEKLADRLARRDREQDERVSCTDCRHYRPGRCGNHRQAGLTTPDLGRDLAVLLQRCPGFDTRETMT